MRGLLPTAVVHDSPSKSSPSRSISPSQRRFKSNQIGSSSSASSLRSPVRSRSGIDKLKRLLSKVVTPSRWPTMDFELAAWQTTYLIIAPRKVYRNVYYHKQTKNTWARDDPAILIILLAMMATAAFLWSSLYLRSWSPITWLALASQIILRDFLLTGIFISILLWVVSNRFLSHSSHTHATDQRVEWQYAFDVHVNSFFPFFLNLYVFQLFLAPVITWDNWVCLWIGNSIYLIASIQYIYVTYLGYNALPFLIRTEVLLFPAVILLGLL
ncbi:hypothetical protein O181_090435 [Austropuccinia psidii MF-1]|uniref:UNC-50-like protein n=1 Tax=Austropuccinia psidii MF-1 TaxID=1389203 RepID=A0A9Q3IVT1_9BASI|nr:hypothetical protein [Austropuccinia psidii MF-1]